MFPFDEQHCTLDLIESWFAFLDYSIVANNESNYSLYSMQSGEWEVTSLDTAKHTLSVHRVVKVSPDRYEREPAKNRSDDALRVKLTLTRTPSYYVFNVLAPLLTIAAIGASLSLFPPSAESKPYLVLCVILAMFMFQSLIFAVSPKTESIPLLGFYVICLLLLSTLYTCWCCFVYLLLHKPPFEKPPRALLASVRGARAIAQLLHVMVNTFASNSLCTFSFLFDAIQREHCTLVAATFTTPNHECAQLCADCRCRGVRRRTGNQRTACCFP